MKVFLSSAVEGLQDARQSYLESLEGKCKQGIRLVSYERDSSRYPGIDPQEICLKLVQECSAMLILLDQYYGTPFKKNPVISITHAEVLEGKSLELTIIPITRPRTWYEFLIWRKNKDKDIRFDHVKDPKLFGLIEYLASDHNIQMYDSLVSTKAFEEIASALDAILDGAFGKANKVLLPIKPEATEEAPKPEIASRQEKRVRRFRDGDVARAEDMNALYQLIIDKAADRDFKIARLFQFKDGEIADVKRMNAMLEAVKSIYDHIGKQAPQWSFGQFRDGMVLRASDMNEIIDNIEAL